MSKDQSNDMRQILNKLIDDYGNQAGYRLFGLLMHVTLNPDDKSRAAKLMWRDVELLKKSGLYPDGLKPADIDKWTRLIFTAGFRATLMITKLVPPKPEELDSTPTEEELTAARELAIKYGLEKFIDPKETKSPEIRVTPGG